MPLFRSGLQGQNESTELFVKRNLLLLLLICSLIAQTAPAASLFPQSAVKRVAAVPAPARLPEAKLVNRVLANGLEVIVLEDHSVPLVTIELGVKNGSYTEPPELNGLSHLYEHMFFKANRAMASQETYLKTIGQLGIADRKRT